MTSSNGNFFRVTGPFAGIHRSRWIPHTERPVTRSFDVFFDPRLHKRLSKQSWGWWFKTPLRPLWRQCNDTIWVSSYRTVPPFRYSLNHLSCLGIHFDHFLLCYLSDSSPKVFCHHFSGTKSISHSFKCSIFFLHIYNYKKIWCSALTL